MTKFYRYKTDKATTYYALSDKIIEGSSPSAELSVIHDRYIPNFVYDEQFKEWQGADDHETLFTHWPAYFEGASAHKSMRHVFPVLGALANREFGKLEVSTSLSRHSSRLARKAAKLGVVKAPKGNVDLRTTNSADFSDVGNTQSREAWDDWATNSQSQIPEQEVQQARLRLREVVRPTPKKPHMSKQFDQHQGTAQLPGVDW